MNVCILGIARSGTTILYTLLQKILMDNYDQNVEFIYEPFLWDKDCFNDILVRVSQGFDYMDSISIKGVYNHLKLPLMIENPDQYKKNEYLNSLLDSSSEKKHILSKFIRACGRYLLLYTISPETKFIFNIRNPVDSVNSITTNFSFYGGEFHRDDFSRFIIEVNRVFGKSYKKEWFEVRLEKELFYWEYMNRFALESFAKTPQKPLILCHEDILINKNKYLQNICDYLKVPLKPKYKDLLLEKVGPITDKYEVSKKELEVYKRYLNEYTGILKDHEIPVSFKNDDILKKYKVTSKPVEQSMVEYGSMPLVIMKKLKEEKIKNIQIIDQNQKLIDEKQKELKKKDFKIKQRDKKIIERDQKIIERDKKIKEKEAYINYVNKLIEQIKKESKLKEKYIERKDKIIRRKSEMITRKDYQAKRILSDFHKKELALKDQLAMSNMNNQLIKNKHEKRLQQIIFSSSFRLGRRIIKTAKFFIGWLPFFKKR